MKFVLRRSLPSVGGLLALVLAVGFVAVLTLGLPLWFPAVFAIAVVLLQYAVNPLIIQWLEHIDRTLRDVNLIREDIRGRLNSVYPLDVLRKIEPYFEPVDSIRNPDASPSTEARPSAEGVGPMQSGFERS